MPMYKGKPIEIEARQLPVSFEEAKKDLASLTMLLQWCNGVLNHNGVQSIDGIAAMWGDWIVKGARGEFYVLKDATFQLSFDPL